MLHKILGRMAKEKITMDVFKLKLRTRFTRKIVSKMISRFIRKEYGYNINIDFDDLDIESLDGETIVKANVELRINNDELIEILEKAGLD